MKLTRHVDERDEQADARDRGQVEVDRRRCRRTGRAPGQEKMFSTSTAPVSTFANASPSTVMIEGSAARTEM